MSCLLSGPTGSIFHQYRVCVGWKPWAHLCLLCSWIPAIQGRVWGSLSFVNIMSHKTVEWRTQSSAPTRAGVTACRCEGASVFLNFCWIHRLSESCGFFGLQTPIREHSCQLSHNLSNQQLRMWSCCRRNVWSEWKTLLSCWIISCASLWRSNKSGFFI